MDIDVNHPEHPANTQPGLHESELNILDRDNTNGLGTLGSFLGFGMFLGATDAITDAFANVDIVGAMPAGPAIDGLAVNTPAPQPAPSVAPQDMGMGMPMHPGMMGPK